MQILRQPSKPLEHLLGVGLERRQGLLRLPVLELSRRALERADPHRHEDELLAHVVVQVLGDPCPRRLLRVDEPSGHLLNPLVARSKRRLPGAYRLLREAQPRPLPEQSGDEHRLHHDHRQRADDDVPVIHVPDRRGDEANVRSRRQRGHVDVPAPQLTPVERRHRPQVVDGNALRRYAAEDLARDRPDPQSGRPARLASCLRRRPCPCRHRPSRRSGPGTPPPCGATPRRCTSCCRRRPGRIA